MRVTSGMMADTFIKNFLEKSEELYKLQKMISSGKRISKPSEDPMGMAKVMGYRKTLCAIDQYSRNIAHGESWISVSSSTLGEVDNLLIRAKELAVSQATETSSAGTRAAVAEEIRNIYDQIMQLANTTVGRSYIFAGHQTDTQPFSRDDDYNATYGDGVQEVTDITCNAANTLTGGEYLTLNSSTTECYVWYTVDGAGADPAVANKTGILVALDGTDSAAAVAAKTAAAIDNAADFRTVSNGAIVTVTNDDAGSDVRNTTDGCLTGFSFQVTQQGAGAAPEITDITCGAQASLDDDDYFTIHSPATDYYVWYDKSGSATDPGTFEPALAGYTGIYVDISGAATDAEVAAATAAAINALGDFGAVSNNEVVTVTNAANGIVTDAADAVGFTGFGVATSTEGEDGDHGDIKIVVGENLEFSVNVNGDDVFTNSNGANIFNILRDLNNALENDDTEGIQAQIEPLDDAKKQVLGVEAGLGAKLNRLEITENHWADFKLDVTGLLSEIEDTDFAEAIISLQTQQAAYQASLGTAAMIIQRTLMDFLK